MYYSDIDQSVLSLRIESMHQMIASDTLNSVMKLIANDDISTRSLGLESLNLSDFTTESRVGQFIRAIWDAIKAAVRAVRKAFASVYKAIRDSLRQILGRTRRMEALRRTPTEVLESKLNKLKETNAFNPSHIDHLRIMGRLEPDVIIKTIAGLVEHINKMDIAFQTAFNVDSRNTTQLIEDLIDLARNVDGEKYSNTVMFEEMTRIQDHFTEAFNNDAHRRQMYDLIEGFAGTTINGPHQIRFKERGVPASYYFESKDSRHVNPELPDITQVNNLSDLFLSLSTSYSNFANTKTGRYDGVISNAYNRREKEFDRLVVRLNNNEQFSQIRTEYMRTLDLIGQYEGLTYLRYPSEIIRHSLRTILALEKYLMEIYTA